MKQLVASSLMLVLTGQLVVLDPFLTYSKMQYGEFVDVSEALVSPSEKHSDFSSLVIVGDVMLARHVEVLKNRHGEDYPFSGISFTAISENPAVLGNFEATIPQIHVPTPAYSFSFSVHERQLAPFLRSGFTHVSLANNHSLDFGVDGIENTRSVLEQNNISSMGCPGEVVCSHTSSLDIDGKKVLIISLDATMTTPDKAHIREVFTSISDDVDYKIAYVHWGNEYQEMHSVEQRQYAEFLVSSGADLIVGHHPHVVQDVDIIDGVPVFYSLGNYIFDQYFSDAVQTGLVLSLSFDIEPIITLLPVNSTITPSRPVLLSGHEKEKFLQDLSLRSSSLVREAIEVGRIESGSLFASEHRKAIISSN